MSRPRVGVSVLVVGGNRILLGQRLKEPNRGLWVLPGGGVDLYETAEDTARREILEETGAKIAVRQLVGVSEIVRPSEEHRIILTFLAELLSPVDELRAGDDLGSPTLFTKAELSTLPISEVVCPVLRITGWLPMVATNSRISGRTFRLWNVLRNGGYGET
jgi:8-oxo-dGTP diphosphatase